MAPMPRIFAAVALVLAACALPTGQAVPACDESWDAVEPLIVTRSDEAPMSVPIDCMVEIDESRIRIGFSMPPGPSCHRLTALTIRESADAVAVSIAVAVVHDPLAGACAEEPSRAVTEVDLQAPVADRDLLDGGAQPVPSGS